MILLSNNIYALLAGSLFGAFVGIAGYHNRALQHVPGSSGKRGVFFISGTLAALLSAICFITAFGIGSFAGAIAITFIVSSWIGLLNTCTEIKVPERLKVISSLEYKILCYPLTGVRFFGYLLKKTVLKKLGGDVFIEGKRKGLNKTLQGLNAAEATHFWGFAGMIPFIIALYLFNRLFVLLGVLIILVLLHVFPIAHTRMIRFRIEKLIK